MIIYLIENVVNNKVYVGQTIRTLEQRWTAHVQSMKNGNGCPALMNAMLKYGVENFTIKQIDSASTKEELDKKETYWITKYNATNRRYGYNIAPGGEGGNTYKHLDEVRMRDIKYKISQSKLGSKNAHAHPIKCKSIKTGVELFFDTVKECAEHFRVKHIIISGRASGRTRRLLNNEWLIAYQDCDYRDYVTHPQGYNLMIAVEVLIDGNWVEFKSLTDAYAKLSLKKPSKKFFRESDTCEYRGYLFRKSNKCVSTIPDECKGVGPEMSAGPKR